jgi:hypothetical protein
MLLALALPGLCCSYVGIHRLVRRDGHEPLSRLSSTRFTCSGVSWTEFRSKVRGGGVAGL